MKETQKFEKTMKKKKKAAGAINLMCRLRPRVCSRIVFAANARLCSVKFKHQKFSAFHNLNASEFRKGNFVWMIFLPITYGAGDRHVTWIGGFVVSCQFFGRAAAC